MADGYRAKGRIHDMRPTDARTKIGGNGPRRTPKTNQQTIDEAMPGLAGIKRAATRNVDKAAARVAKPAPKKPQAGPTKERAKAMNKANRRQKMGKLGKGLNSMAKDNDKLAAQSQADMQDFRNRAAGMSAERQRMQQSTPGRAAQIIKNRRA